MLKAKGRRAVTAAGTYGRKTERKKRQEEGGDKEAT